MLERRYRLGSPAHPIYAGAWEAMVLCITPSVLAREMNRTSTGESESLQNSEIPLGLKTTRNNWENS